VRLYPWTAVWCGNRQAVFTHALKVHLDSPLDQLLNLLSCIGNGNAPGEVWNIGAPVRLTALILDVVSMRAHRCLLLVTAIVSWVGNVGLLEDTLCRFWWEDIARLTRNGYSA